MNELHNLNPVPLIARLDLFGNPEKSGAQISPDGRRIAWLAPLDGVMNIWVAPRDAPSEAAAITKDTGRGIGSYAWAYDMRHLLFVQDQAGDENFHVFAAAIESWAIADLTPFIGARAGIASFSRKLPGEVLVSLNRRDPRHADLFRVEIATGRMTLVAENPGFAGFLVDDDFVPRIAVRRRRDGGSDLMRAGAEGRWEDFISLSSDDARTSGPSHLDASSRTLFFYDSRGCNTAALTAVEIATGATRLLAWDPQADIGGVIPDRHSYEPLACSVTRERTEYRVLDERIRPDIEFLDAKDLGEWGIGSRTEDDRHWTISASSDLRPGVAYLYDRETRTLTKLHETRPRLAAAPLERMHPVTIAARDGLDLVSYLTLPNRAGGTSLAPPKKALPMVLVVHGGPWTRDVFGYHAMHQWLANRGYAVLSVNFRGSTGFGKAFVAAGDREWGRRMDDDLSDAVDWVVARGFADPDRVGILGGSYGGYAVLAAMTRNPGRYACGIDIFGPSNLETLLAAIPAYWESNRAMLYRAVGDPGSESGRQELAERSPLHQAARIEKPLLVIQGANDPRVKQSESDQMVAALKHNGIPVTYVVYPDEGHGFVRAPNRVSSNAIIELFLARHLGGRAEAATAGETDGATFRVIEGADWVLEALPNAHLRAAQADDAAV
jgi:dipeptidyl aminopeptidase/acylaminoacyl peptidase